VTDGGETIGDDDAGLFLFSSLHHFVGASFDIIFRIGGVFVMVISWMGWGFLVDL